MLIIRANWIWKNSSNTIVLSTLLSTKDRISGMGFAEGYPPVLLFTWQGPQRTPSLPLTHKSTIACHLSLAGYKAFCSSKEQSILPKWQQCSWYKLQGDVTLWRRSIKPFLSLWWWRTIFVLVSLANRIYFLSPTLCQVPTHLRHTHIHTYYTRGSPSERRKVGKSTGAEQKYTLWKEKQKIQIFAIWYSRWEADMYGYISLHQFDSQHSRYLILFNTGFSSFSFQNCSSFCMGSVVYFYVFKYHKQTPDSFG